MLYVAASWLVLSALAGLAWWAMSAGMRRTAARERRRRGMVTTELSRAILHAAEVADRQARRLAANETPPVGHEGAEARALRLEADALHREWLRLENPGRPYPPA